MEYAFIKYLKSIVPHYRAAKYLLAVSGGIDSMLMLWLFNNAKLKFAVANINFNLRGEEADLDSQLVIDFCKKNQIKIFHKAFDTTTYAQEHKISIQMAARDIRYQWFEELANENSFDYIPIAHHLDDQSETFFINLIRGTGVAGLHGLARNKNRIIRPLMFCNRVEISKFVEINKIPFREDSSNASDKYQRNYIRHHILPEFYHLQDNFSKKLNTTTEYISELEAYANVFLEKEAANLKLESNDGLFKLNINTILEHPQPRLICYYILSEFGFSSSHIEDLIALIKNENSGKSIHNNDYNIQIERSEIILKANSGENIETEIFIKSYEDANWKKFGITVFENNNDNYKIVNQNLAFLDMDKIKFPLQIRNWRQGDSFQPLGMKGTKKISDYFIDNKFSQNQKENTLLLCDEDRIIWIIGHRISNRYSITSNTNKILKLEYNGNN